MRKFIRFVGHKLGCRLGAWRRTTGRHVQSSHGNERRLRRKHAFAVAPHAGQDLAGVTQGPPESNIWFNRPCLTRTLIRVQGLGGMPSMPNMQGKPRTFCFFSKSCWSRRSSCHVSSIVASTKLPSLCAGPPPGANMGMMNPEMMGMMPQHDVGMGFDMSAGTRLSTCASDCLWHCLVLTLCAVISNWQFKSPSAC